METKSLGKQTLHVYSGANMGLLDRVPSPMPDSTRAAQWSATVEIRAEEFTSVCPVTGGPDFATIEIEYIPEHWLVESKSLKLYLGSFRNEPMFHEKIVTKICEDLVALLDPRLLTVTGMFNPRGGISIHPYCHWSK